MFIKRLHHNIYDVFVGTQWDEWTRVQRFQWGLKVIGGRPLSRADFREATQRLVK